MEMFYYECINKSGETIKGQLSGENKEGVIEQLRKLGYAIIDIKETKKAKSNSFLTTQKKVKTSDLTILSKQLASMLNSGIPLTRALSTLGKQTENPTLRNAIVSITQSVESGMNFSDALATFPAIFSKLFIGMVFAGELGGKLDKTLEMLSVQLQREQALKNNIKSATLYPRVILSFAVLLMIALLVFMIPIFANFFPKGVTIPLPTKIVIAMSDFLRNRWYILIIGVGIIFFGIKYYIKSDSGKYVWDRVKFKMPAFGKLIKKTVVARFTRTLASLLDSGVPVIQSLETAAVTAGSVIMYDSVIRASKNIEQGKDIAGELERTAMFPPMVIHMVAIGEETGSLPTMLGKVAEYYEEEVSTMSKGLTALIEPIMLISVGLMVGMMLVAMYLPIFSSVAAIH
jgi:type IV pilus assembly protein PilC